MYFYHQVLQNVLRNSNKKWIHNKTRSISYPQFSKDLPKTQCTRLHNELTVATEERDSTNVCMGLYVDVGSRHEDNHLNGITYFFNHMVYKGTQKQAKIVLEDNISNMAAKFICSTSRDTTALYVECATKELPRAMDILVNSIFNNALTETEIELQKNIIYQEMLEHEKSTSGLLYDYLHTTAFQGTPLSQSVMGLSKSLRNFKSSLIFDHICKYFIPQRIVVAAVGGIKHELIINLVEQYFKTNKESKSIVLGPSRYTGSQIVYRDDSVNAAHVAIGVEGPPYDSEDRLPMEIASSVIGGWDTSQPGGINHGVRVAHIASAGALCESYNTFNIYYQDTGLWGVEYISPRKDVDDMLLTVQEEWMRLCHMITDGELIRAKNETKSKLLMKVQTTASAFHDLGQNVLRTGCQLELRERLQAIDDITANDIKKVGDKYLYNRCPVVVGIGSTECLFDYSRIRSYMYWLRV